MRFSTLLFLASASLVKQVMGQILSAKDTPLPPAYPVGFSNEPFAKVSGRLFDINGTIQYFTGTNAWWLAHLTNNSDVDIALSQIKEAGYKVIRVWGFSDSLYTKPRVPSAQDPERVFFQLLNKTGAYVNYGPNGIQRMDYLVSACERLGLKLVLPFVNFWDDWGGIQLYMQMFAAPSDRVWYTVPKCQEVYRDWVKIMVSRYKKSPAIFSWQLINEPRCSACSKAIIPEWAAATSQYIKELDPDHMVSLGDEGWLTKNDSTNNWGPMYDGFEGVNFGLNLANISTLDYGTFHLYPSLWGYKYEWGSQWILEHDAIGARVGKPVILEEYGASMPMNHSYALGPWQETVLRTGLAADQVWQFGPNGTSVDPLRFGDLNSIYFGNEEFIPLVKQHTMNMMNKKVPAR